MKVLAYVLSALRGSSFIWRKEWVRNWNAQPVELQYTGTPREGSTFSYSIRWSPASRTLTLTQRVGQPTERVVSTSCGALLTRLIEGKKPVDSSNL